jgi:hypothetical protein
MDDGGRRTGSGTAAVGTAIGMGTPLGTTGTGSTGEGTGAGELVSSRPAMRMATAIPR